MECEANFSAVEGEGRKGGSALAVSKEGVQKGGVFEERYLLRANACMTGEGFLVEVQQRNAATLLPIVQNFIRPGSIVYSDE